MASLKTKDESIVKLLEHYLGTFEICGKQAPLSIGDISVVAEGCAVDAL
jgi:hypothetical protein